ncbi:tetratricopeptide repeat-containing, partial [Fusarium sporotrichioides]
MATVLPYHGVTYRQNPAFYPRPQYLEQISAVLGPDTPRGLTSFALVGFGGCGKTQLAIEYTHRTNHYDAIFWCAAENSLQLSESFAMHARQLDLIKGDDVPQQDRIISLVKQRLLSLSVNGKPSRWLMVFDNMEPFDGLSSFWPSGLSGSILVTTRNKTLAKEFTKSQVSIPPFEPLDAQRFLLQYRTSGTEHTCQEDNAAEIISQRLGNLPLALDLVRHHVSASGSSYKEFLRCYGEPTVNMIHLLAILDVSCIPLSIFGADKEDMLCNGPDVEDELPQLQDLLESPVANIYELDTVVSELMDGSLIDRNVGSGSLSLHRILQDSVAHSFDAATRSRSFSKVLFYLNGCFPTQRDGGLLFEQWYLCEHYIPHIFSVVQFYRKNIKLLDPPVMLAEIIRRCAWYLLEKHQFTEAKILVRDAVEICKRARTSSNLLGFTRYRYIPRLLSDLYNVMGALEYESNTEGHGLRWAMKARSIRQELCLTLDLERDKSNGQLREALPLLEAVHEYDASTSGVNTDNFYRTLSLSICYRLLGKYIHAVDCSNIAMKVIQEHIGEDSVPMATARFCWGNLLLCMEDRVGAYNAFSMCFLTRQKLMPTHFDTAFTAHKLGAMALQNGDLDPMSLAAIRTAYLLSIVLLQSNQSDAAKQMRSRVNQALEAKGKRVDAKEA